MIKVEIWSDYVCPFCYIGKTEFLHAVKKLGLEDKIEVINKAFLLDPTVPFDSDELMADAMMKKYNFPKEQLNAMYQKVIDRAASVGLTYNFDDMKNANTFYAHKLVKWAETLGKEHELNHRLLKAFFEEGQHIGQVEVLKTLAAEVGLDANKVESVLADSQWSHLIEEDVMKAQEIGARGVPLFLIDNKHVISGAQPQEVFIENLTKAAAEHGINL